MPTHTLLFKPKKKYYQDQLENILIHRNIPISQCELRDYRKSELIILINKFSNKYNFAKKKESFWYRESIHNNYHCINI
jgi:hypothetical protein